MPSYNSKNGLNIFNHLPTNKLQEAILKSKLVVCRAGYSSIMDLDVLKKDAILIPTPGQTEQEYLTKHHIGNSQFEIQSQQKINLNPD